MPTEVGWTKGSEATAGRLHAVVPALFRRRPEAQVLGTLPPPASALRTARATEPRAEPTVPKTLSPVQAPLWCEIPSDFWFHFAEALHHHDML